MEQIRVNRGIEIGVNDNGDSIFIDVENTLWVREYKNLIDTIQNIVDSVKGINSTDMDDTEQLDIVIAKMREVTTAIDKQFGTDTCKKVFGDIVPSPVAVIEFFDLLTPIVQKYADERAEKITTKYSKNRKGGKR